MSFKQFLREKIERFLVSEARQSQPAQPQLSGLLSVDGEGEIKSNYDADSPSMRVFANASPENLAQVLIFVMITPRVRLDVVYQTLPIIMAILKTKFGNRRDVKTEELEAEINRNQDSGVTLKNAIYGFKINGILNIWNNRDQIYEHVKTYSSSGNENVVALMDYLSSFPGLDIVKAGFAVQCVMGKMGCIDVHNLLIYTHHLKSLNKHQKAKMLDPKNYTASGKKQSARLDAIERYLKVLKMLESEGFGTKQLWDVWTNFVGNMSVNLAGESPYNTDLGTGVEPETLARFKGGIPRMGREVPMTASNAGRAVGLAHDIPGRQPEDLLLPGMDIAASTRPGARAQRYPSFQAMSPRRIDKTPVDKLMIWVARDPDMGEKLGLSPMQVSDLRQIVKDRGISLG